MAVNHLIHFYCPALFSTGFSVTVNHMDFANYRLNLNAKKEHTSVVWQFFGEPRDNNGTIIEPNKCFSSVCLQEEHAKTVPSLKSLKLYNKTSSTGTALKNHTKMKMTQPSQKKPKEPKQIELETRIFEKIWQFRGNEILRNFFERSKKNYMGLPITSECLLMDPLQWWKRIKVNF